MTTTVAVPVRTLDQRLAALATANVVRVDRAKLKRALKSAATSFEDVMRDPPPCVASARVFDLLCCIPKFGRVKAAKLMNRSRVSHTKTVGGLTERQRLELVAQIQGLGR